MHANFGKSKHAGHFFLVGRRPPCRILINASRNVLNFDQRQIALAEGVLPPMERLSDRPQAALMLEVELDGPIKN